MSELINARADRASFRWQLLTTVSALALLASVSVRDAKAEDQDTDRPTIWIELGGQLKHVSGQGDIFTPGFVAANPNSPVLQPVSPLQAQKPVPFSFAENGKISFQPESSDWVFSAAVKYGRSSNAKHVDHQTIATHPKYNGTVPGSTGATVADFADTHVQHRESHTVLDFSVGKDVGLGLFGRESSSILNFGVRFAQFASQATFDARARPDLEVNYKYAGAFKIPKFYFHTYHATGQASRSFHGIGPSLSWNGSTPFMGNPQNGEIAFDWGVNAALLFGRQKAHVKHQETSRYYNGHGSYSTVYQHPPGGHETARSVVVPNVGGFAGVSFHRGGAKVSFGYRADFFFGAIDGGIDTRKSETTGFYGPFASVSVGIGG
jgi:iron complex outermembrane recepter protein